MPRLRRHLPQLPRHLELNYKGCADATMTLTSLEKLTLLMTASETRAAP